MLFDRPISDYYRGIRIQVEKAIRDLDEQTVADSRAEELAAQICHRHLPVCPQLAPPILDPPTTPASAGHGLQIVVRFPFEGDADLFSYMSGTAPILAGQVSLQKRELVAMMPFDVNRPEKVEKAIDALEARIRDEGLAPLARGMAHHNQELRDRATAWIRDRQEAIRQTKQASAQLATLKYAIRRRDDAAAATIVPVKQKPIAVATAPQAESPQPSHAISDGDYDEILRTISHMAKVFERSPTVFKKMEEEDLRTVLLVALNGVFQGAATGETFNGEGKTDILVRAGGDNVFIAECLMWEGPARLDKKVTEQLFRYSTWRDSKLAVIVFNRKKNFSDVVAKMKDVAVLLPGRETELAHGFDAASACRYQFHRQDDPQKKFVVTFLAFDVPV
jgi:hypothetical protein